MSLSATKRRGADDDETPTASSTKRAKEEPDAIDDDICEMIARAVASNKKATWLLQNDSSEELPDLTPPLTPLRPFTPPPPPPSPPPSPLMPHESLNAGWVMQDWKGVCPRRIAESCRDARIFFDPLKPAHGDLPPVGRKYMHHLAEAAFQAALQVSSDTTACTTNDTVSATFNGIEETKPLAILCNGIESYHAQPQDTSSTLPPVSKKACQLLEMANALHKDMQSKLDWTFHGSIKLVAVGDLLYSVECMIAMQDVFRGQNKPTRVDLGYHYTRGSNMENIRLGGLMTHDERQDNNINNNFNGAAYGDGIYTGNNPFAFHRFRQSDIGLLVARVQGQKEQATPKGILRRCALRDDNESNANTVVAGMGYREIIVLRSSSQCVALVQFDASLIDMSNGDSPGCNIVHEYHVRLQKILDTIFNDGYETFVPNFQPPVPYHQRLQGTVLPYTSPPTEHVVYKAPDELGIDCLESFDCLSPAEISSSDCPICLSDLKEQKRHVPIVVCMKSCKHQFHYKCISMALQHTTTCPVCRKHLAKPQGKMPSGSMTIARQPFVACTGHGPGTIVIDYKIEGGTQKAYHQNPGCSFPGTFRKAFVPDNDEGQKLLKRLKWAFSHGLTFTVGTSLTTGRHNVVTWASIHHKSTTSRGAFGFPDRFYFARCNHELDVVQVPPAKDL